jgi:hypothetical protein
VKLVVEQEYAAKCDNARLLRRQRAHIPELNRPRSGNSSR